MKTYPIADLRGNTYLNPSWASHQRSAGTIKKIAIHHDAVVRPHSYDSVARYTSEAKEHYARLGPGLQYHYKIDNTGTIFQIRDHTTWLYAVGTTENTSTIHICLDGYFHAPHNQKPTREQYEALSQLLIQLCEKTPSIPASYPDVWCHRSFKATACPGDNLAPYVFQVSSKATALNIPTDVVYDWPELQPSQPTPPTKPPVVVVPPPVVVPPAPTPPVAPPPEVQTDDWGQQNNTLLKQILALLQGLVDKIGGIFK